jgi:hypothetical protein
MVAGRRLALPDPVDGLIWGQHDASLPKTPVNL